ncbi:MAG: hypothetical protein N3B01_09535, partial [Verrucomicrobiae bacterium]|nr:hypothetical protein [Verrucomicrobiae bacterium]
MTAARLKQLVRLAAGFREFAKTPLTYEQALDIIRRQTAERETRFVENARRLIYTNAASPYRQLLLWAGCGPGDLETSVKTRGLEKTLEQLCDAGVRLSLDEFKARTPICRRGLTIETCERDFDNPLLGGHRLEGVTSGSRGKSTRVAYDWDFITEESAHELLLYQMHGVLNAPTALWFPVPPGIAGIHNLLMSLKIGRPPAKWFSQTPPETMSLEARLALCLIGRPHPEFADLSRADKVVAWLATVRPGVVRTYSSSAVRIAQAALHSGADTSGCVLFAGGEPLTEQRRSFIVSAGLKVFPRYVITETGLVAAACPESAPGEMHFYTDRLAVIQHDGNLLFTSLSAHAGKILLNVELGDCGELVRKRCSCPFGELGLDLHISNVRSNEKLTIEGMTVSVADLYAAVEAAAGRPDCCQLWQAQDERGLSNLVVAVSPDVPCPDETRFAEAVLNHLGTSCPANALAANLWQQAGSLRIVREPPRLTPAQK